MPAPFEVLADLASAYWAPAGTVAPVVNVAPAAPWALIGTNTENQVSPVTLRLVQTIVPFRGGGAGMRRAAFRTDLDRIVAFSVADATLEGIRIANGMATISTVVGPPATKRMGLAPALGKLTPIALLLRGPSPYLDGVSAQYVLPLVVEQGSAELTYQRGTPVAVAFEFAAIADVTQAVGEQYGWVEAQTA